MHNVDVMRLSEYLIGSTQLRGHRPVSFLKGATIPLPCKCIGILISGNVSVHRYLNTGQRVLMHRLSPMDIFGMLALKAPLDESGTELSASTPCRIVWVEELDLLEVLQRDTEILQLYLNYLHGRIQFLNYRLACFNYSNARERLDFVKSHSEWLPAMSKTALAEYMGVSRATLYRLLNQS